MGAPAHEVVMDIDRPAVPFLVVHIAERRAHVGIGQVADQGEHPVDPHLDVLVLGKLVEIAGNTSVERRVRRRGSSNSRKLVWPTPSS